VRDFAIFNSDYTLRLSDGWLQLRYWLWYSNLALGQDLSGQPVRLWLHLNGLELHIYNQFFRYEQIFTAMGVQVEKQFVSIFKQDRNTSQSDTNLSKLRNRLGKHAAVESVQGEETTKQNTHAYGEWEVAVLQFLAKVKCVISSGRVVFGNNILPTAFVASFDVSSIVKPYDELLIIVFIVFINQLDIFMKHQHIILSTGRQPHVHYETAVERAREWRSFHALHTRRTRRVSVVVGSHARLWRRNRQNDRSDDI
jgi:hypothetical protein